ncbi:MAG: hypothetical protein NTU98_07345 [Bacteroidetes bacterium]|nr:hypothetical protein [Bacteroidota bacterium]
MKRRSKWIGIVGGVVLVPAGIVVGLLLYMTITDYYPPEKEILPFKGTGVPLPVSKRSFSFLTWNIGYSGLGEKMDFFYENGKRVRPAKAEFSKYLAGIKKLLSDSDTVDMVLLQEADVHAKRSYSVDEIEELSKVFPGHSFVFAKNYDCRFVPLPLDEPMGQVISGISCFTRFIPQSAERIDFGTTFSWPKQIFFLKRCFIVLRYYLSLGKQLVIINTHNSTYDEDGKLRKKELLILKRFMLAEFEKGNYVIAGGDWNNNPPGFDAKAIRTGDVVKTVEPPIDPQLFPGWQVASDPSSPTNRDVDMPYRKGITRTTIIDFYIVSPNVEIRSVKTIVNGFTCSDHQPVFMNVALK